MALMKTPAAPELFQKKTGMWAIIFPTVSLRGGKCLGSEHLATTDDKTARRLFKQWKDQGRFQKIVAQDQKAAEAYRERKDAEKAANGNSAHLPVVIDATPRRKRQSARLAAINKQARMLVAQLHALALNAQMIVEETEKEDDY